MRYRQWSDYNTGELLQKEMRVEVICLMVSKPRTFIYKKQLLGLEKNKNYMYVCMYVCMCVHLYNIRVYI